MKRNYGVDCLRIISMLMVVVLHILGQGGILANTEPLSLKYWIAWFMEIASYCCVNCFALISGYVMYQSAFKPSRVLKVWFQTIFYTALTVIVFLIFKTEAVRGSTIVYAVFPISSAQYWYVSAYFGMLLIMPLLNNALHYTEEKVLKIVLISVLVVFCILPTALRQNPYALNAGYSMAWLSILYLVGGCIRKYNAEKQMRSRLAGGIALAMVAATFFVKFIAETFFQGIPFLLSYSNVLISYTSPTIVVMSVGLLIAFSNLKLKPITEKIIGFISPAVLGVYLFHVNPLVWEHCMKDIAVDFVKYNCVVMVLLIVLLALLIFFIGIYIEKIRIKLYDLLKIDRLCVAADARVSSRTKVKE